MFPFHDVILPLPYESQPMRDLAAWAHTKNDPWMRLFYRWVLQWSIIYHVCFGFLLQKTKSKQQTATSGVELRVSSAVPSTESPPIVDKTRTPFSHVFDENQRFSPPRSRINTELEPFAISEQEVLLDEPYESMESDNLGSASVSSSLPNSASFHGDPWSSFPNFPSVPDGVPEFSPPGPFQSMGDFQPRPSSHHTPQVSRGELNRPSGCGADGPNERVCCRAYRPLCNDYPCASSWSLIIATYLKIGHQ